MIGPLGFELKAGRTVHITTECWDLEELIKGVYGIFDDRYFSIIAMEEWHNDSSHEFSVSRGPISKWGRADLDGFMQTSGSVNYGLYLLLQDMCNQGHIEEGEYLVRVSW